jgi:hypothetical protein
MMEAIVRGWENFMARSSDPLNFRFIIQPAVAITLAFLAGLKDAKKSNPPYLWAMFTNPNYRRTLLHEGWKDMRTPFIIALILDSVYQLITHQGIYLLELLFTAFFLALIPYIVFRGVVNRIARLLIRNQQETNITADDTTKTSKEIPKTFAKQNINTSKKETNMTDTPEKKDWTKPAAMAIPKEGFFTKEEGRYGPIYPKTPACYGFTIIAKIKPGREETIRQYGKTIEETIKELPDALAVLKLHYLRWVLFDIKGETYFMYQGIFDTDFDKYTEDAVSLFSKYGLVTVFENLEGFPEDWKTNAPAFVKFVREHQRPSFLEYGEYPYVSAEEIKKALQLKDSFSKMLDQMQ